MADRDRLSRFGNATQTLRETTKWIVTISTALGSVLVAGLSFGDLGERYADRTSLILGSSGAILALAGIGTVLLLASRVLTATSVSVFSILKKSADNSGRLPPVSVVSVLKKAFSVLKNAAHDSGRLPPELIDRTLNFIQKERSFWLGNAEVADVRSLFSELRQLEDELIESRQSGPFNQEREGRRRRRDELVEASERVVDCADYVITRRRFTQLLFGVLGGGVMVTTGIFLFAVGVSGPKPIPVGNAGKPVPVRVFLNEEGRTWASVHLGCEREIIEGFAVGGDFSQPEIVIPPLGNCTFGRLKVTKTIGLVIPKQ